MISNHHMFSDLLTNHPIAILSCIIVYYMIGMVWYGFLFQKQYTRFNNIDPNTVTKENMIDGMRKGSLASFVTGLALALVLGVGIQQMGSVDWKDLFLFTTILWLTFTALPFAQTNAYLRKSFKLTLIDAGYMLVSVWAMTLILYKTIL